MINRRQTLIGASAGLAIGALARPFGAKAAEAPRFDIAALDPVETMVRMRSRSDQKLSISWLDAQRDVVLNGDVTPFCRMAAVVMSQFRRQGDLWAARTIERAYYCDPASGVLLKEVTMPGAVTPVTVPIYRSGPHDVRFHRALDEWERHEPKNGSVSSEAFAPPSWVHLVRGVRDPSMIGDDIYLRADEYGRAYADRAKPPSVFYREWIVWRAKADAIFDKSITDVPADYSYSAITSFRPWMKVEGIRGHTAENGRGTKIASIDELPEFHRKLLAEHDPVMLDNPLSMFT